MEKALELDPELAEAYATLGLITADIDLDIYRADQFFKKAIDLNPGSSEVHSSYCQYLRWVGRYEECIMNAKRAVELDPLSVMSNIWLASGYYYARKHNEAIDYLNYMLEMDLKVFYVYLHLAYNSCR